MTTAHRWLVFVGALVLAGCGEYVPEAVKEARAFYASKPRYLQPVPHTRVPKGLPDLRAATCGSCHTEFYKEWQISTHARAWLDDAQFQGELDKAKKQNYDWICVNCHTPVENQLPRLVTRLENGSLQRPVFTPNPWFDPELQKEAITCATCHVRDGVVLGPYGNTDAPHPVRKGPELLQNTVCTQCHQAQARLDEVDLICVFNTGGEHANSPYGKNGETCQSCHMPEVVRPLAPDSPPRRTRRHWFGGSLIPKKPEYAAEMQALRAHYPAGLTGRWRDAPKNVKAGVPLTVTAVIQNANAGHMLPTGDPERFLLVQLEARTADGTRLAARTERIGTVYEWYPKARKLADNRLAPKETRTYDLKLDALPKGKVQLILRASRWRINEENLKYHKLEGIYVAGQTFLELRHDIEVR
jgi:hypothetical protein